jgi:hypothetical protein
MLLSMLVVAVLSADARTGSCSEVAALAEQELFAACSPSPNIGEETAIAVFAAREGLSRCPDEEGLWYAFLRGNELGDRSFEGEGFKRFPKGLDLLGKHFESLEAVADHATVRFPGSARIATVRARLHGSVRAAREALAVDASHPPAQVALGRALIAAGQLSEGTAALKKIPESTLRKTHGGMAALGRALLLTGNPNEAITAARVTVNTYGCGDDYERNGSGPFNARVKAEAQETIGLANLAIGKTLPSIWSLLTAWSLGRSSARDALMAHGKEPAVVQALTAVSREKSSWDGRRELASSLLKDLAPSRTP